MQLLDSLNYVSRYLSNKSHILELNSLLKDDTIYKCQQIALDQIKSLLTKALTLAHYDYSKNIIV